MLKLAVFDLDGTLTELGKGILPKDIELLKELEDSGVRIAICSGKPAYYLCGFMRQVGLKHPILIGENGATIQFGVDLPPKEYYVLPYSSVAKESLKYIKESLDSLLSDMWYQPNEVGLTPFPRNEEEFEIIANFLSENHDKIKDVDGYRHVDSFDITPIGINKKSGLGYLGKLLNILPEETVAIGDGVNDYPMFEYAGYSIGIRVKDQEKVDRNFNELSEVLEFLLHKELPIETKVVNLLKEKQWHISFAESCTAGLAAARLVNVGDASKVFDASHVTYANTAKINYLGVSEESIKNYGVVSEVVAIEMAKGVARNNNAEVGVGITGIAGPGGGTPTKPVGMVCFGFVVGDKTISFTKKFGNIGRNKVREASVKFVYDVLLQELS